MPIYTKMVVADKVRACPRAANDYATMGKKGANGRNDISTFEAEKESTSSVPKASKSLPKMSTKRSTISYYLRLYRTSKLLMCSIPSASSMYPRTAR